MHRIIRSRLGLLAGALILVASGARASEEIALGATAPEFDLEGTDGKRYSLGSLTAARDGRPAAQATVVVFTCNMCPYAKAYEPILIELAKKYADKPVAWVLVNPNDPTIVPGDSFEKMKERATEKSYPFPYVFDATQATAHAYGASRTPHVFLLDGERIVRYRGRINDNQDPKQVKSHDLVDAIDAVLAGKEVATASTKAFGCSIKWKKES